MYVCLICTLVHQSDDGQSDEDAGSSTRNVAIATAAGGILIVIIAIIVIIILLCCCCRGRKSKGMYVIMIVQYTDIAIIIIHDMEI